jgi:hypothetical protein
MFCPANANTGLIQLVGPIAASDLKGMTNAQSPLSIKFEPRSTPPSLSGNQIIESPNNTCTYNAQKFNLESVQIVSSVHTGYNLPGNTDTPVAELILSFVAKSPPSSSTQLSGILMCLPIYESSSTGYDAYLKQIFENDPTKPNNATLESLFYSTNTEISQTSLGYRTCFETSDPNGRIESRSIYVLVFPHGIHFASASYRMPKNSLITYQLPSGLRGNNATVRKYTIDDDGKKKVTQIDPSGIMYTIPVSTCSDEFKNGRFEYFTFPPQVSSRNTTHKKVTEGFDGTCPNVKQYKCIPFDQLRDLENGYVQMKDGKCLDNFIRNNNSLPANSNTSISDSSNFNVPNGTTTTDTMSVDNIEEIAGIVIGGSLVLMLAFWAISFSSKSNQ